MPEEPEAAGGSNRVGLVRDLGLFDITMVGVGAMIGAGIFVLTGLAAGTAGPALILAFALNGVVTILTAMVYAELGSAIPEAGGGYLWVKEGMPAWNAFMAGWMSWFAHAVAGSLYALGFGSYVELMLREFGVTSVLGFTGEPLHKALAVGIALAFVLINFKGVSETGVVGNIVTMGKIAILGIFVVSGVAAIFRNPQYMDKFTPFAPEGLTGVFLAMGLTYIAFEGYEIIVQAGEEVRNPRETIPKAVFLSLAIVIPIYMLVAFTALGAVNPETGEPTWQWLGGHAELGLAEAARQFMPLGTTLLLVGGLLSTMSALNATTFSSTRVSFAMGRDRNLPDLFGEIHEATRTPYLALLCSGGLIVVMAVTLPIHDVAAAADVMFLLLFLQVNVAVITIRKKYGDKLDYGFLIPFHPVLPIVNMAMIGFLAVFMFQFSAVAWFFVIGWLGAGFLLYVVYASGREREKRVTPVIFRGQLAPEKERFRVLVPVSDPEDAAPLLEVAARLARPADGELVLLHVATVAPQTPLRAGRVRAMEAREIVDEAEERAQQLGVPALTLVRVGHRPSQGIVDTVEEWDVDFVVMGWHRRPGRGRRHLGRNIDPVLRGSPTSVVVVETGTVLPAGRIVVPIARPENVPLLLGLARLVRSDGPKIEALHVVPPEISRSRREERIEELREAIARPAFFDPEEEPLDPDAERITLEIVDSPNVVQTIADRSEGADLLVIGWVEEGWLRRRIFGTRSYWAARKAECPAILVNQETHPVKFSFQSFFQFFRQLEEEAEKEEEKVSAESET